MRIGNGYDAHRLKQGRPMILCGVELPSDFGPDGHSDADVALHALCDALLGALALGDIGLHFPDSDERYKGANSRELLAQVYALVRENGHVIENADITIVLQSPKLRPYILQMRECVSSTLDCELNQISIKATTEEHMGFTGSGEGIAAYAAVLLKNNQE